MTDTLSRIFSFESLRRIKWTPFLAGTIVSVLVAPLLMNFVIWKGWVAPAESQFMELRQVESLYRIKPEMERLLAESDLLIGDRLHVKYLHSDPSEAIRQIRQLADACQVQIEEISTNDKKPLTDLMATDFGNRYSQMGANLQVLGSFHGIVDWIRAIEKQPGFLIENWQIRPKEEGDDLSRLYLDLKIVMVES